MAKKKNHWYVLVISNSGPVFVTKINYADKTAFWNKNEKPLELNEGTAKDLVLGLNCNLYTAYSVCHFSEIDSQPYNYADWDVSFVPTENDVNEDF